MIALILSNHKKAILSPFSPPPPPQSSKQTVIPHITGRQKQLRDRRFLTSNRVPPPPTSSAYPTCWFFNWLFPIFFLKGIFYPGPSASHNVSFKQTRIISLSPLPPSPLTDNILSYTSLKRCWTEFSLSKTSRLVFVTGEHSWLPPAALWWIQMEHGTYK